MNLNFNEQLFKVIVSGKYNSYKAQQQRMSKAASSIVNEGEATAAVTMPIEEWADWYRQDLKTADIIHKTCTSKGINNNSKTASASLHGNENKARIIADFIKSRI